MGKRLGLAGVLATRFFLVAVIVLPLILMCLFLGIPFLGYEGRFRASEKKEFDRLQELARNESAEADFWMNERIAQAQSFLVSDPSVSASVFFMPYNIYSKSEIEFIQGLLPVGLQSGQPEFSVSENNEIILRLSSPATGENIRVLTLGVKLETFAKYLNKGKENPSTGDICIFFGNTQVFPLRAQADLPVFDDEAVSLVQGSPRRIVSSTSGEKYLLQSASSFLFPQMEFIAYSAFKKFRAALRAEVFATGFSLALSILFLIGVLVIVSRRALGPLQQLGTRMRTFQQDFSLPIDLKFSGPMEVFAINESFVSLATDVVTMKKNLTQNLSDARILKDILSAVIHVLLTNQKSSALVEALAVISKAFGDCTTVIILDREDGSAIARDSTGGVVVFSNQDWKSIRDTLEDPVWQAGERKLGYPLLFIEPTFSMDCSIISKGIRLGHLSVLRDQSFEERDSILLSNIVDSLAPILSMRYSQSHEESLRKEAEASLRESDRKLRDFIDNSVDMIYTTDVDDRFVSLNKAGYVLLGLSGQQQWQGRLFADFVLNSGDRENLFHRIRTKSVVQDYELILARSDGSTVYCIESSRAVHNSNGDFVGVQGMLKDISARIDNERQIWKSNMELTEANFQLKQTQKLILQQEKLASIGQLAAGVAHEINNPLGFLKSNHEMTEKFIQTLIEAWQEIAALHPVTASTIAERYETGYLIDSLHQMGKESADGLERIVHIVSNLKTFSRMDPEGTKAPYNLNAGIESSLVMAWNELKYVATIDKKLGDLPDIEVSGNEINQVILNILVNAGQAIASQGRTEKGTIAISTEEKEGWLICKISDDGPGIPDSCIQKVFDPFFTTKEPGKGTGLGLSISYDIIVNKHGGRLTVDSVPGKRTVFTMSLPVKTKSL